MLSEKEKAEIQEELGHSQTRRAAVPEALKIVQRHRGWVSDAAIQDVAEFLEMTPDEVDAVATFYSLVFRRRVGRHVILLCDSVSCYVTGYNVIRKRLNESLGIDLGQTTADGKFTLLPASCLGLCEQAPAMIVDQDTHGQLTPEKVDEVLARYT